MFLRDSPTIDYAITLTGRRYNIYIIGEYVSDLKAGILPAMDSNCTSGYKMLAFPLSEFF